MSKKLMKIKWEDLRVGDTIAEDGAVVKSLFPWQEQPCYELETEEDGVKKTVIVSETHLFATKFESVIDENGKVVPVTELETTKKSMKQTFKRCVNWISTKDAYFVFKSKDADEAVVDGLFGKIVVRPYKNLEPQKCRCIETSLGTFQINGVLFGNSARGEHSLTEMKDIVADLSRSGMSDQWISKNLFLDPEAITRFKQLSGMKAAFNDENYKEDGWDPVRDGVVERRKNINLTLAARRYVRKYRALRGFANTVASDESIDIIMAAKNLGWDPENPGEMPKTLDKNGNVFEKEYENEEDAVEAAE